MWENKVQTVIGKLCYASWYQANHDKNGKRFKRHRPYAVPHAAQQLVEILGMHDRQLAETTAKTCLELFRVQGIAID